MVEEREISLSAVIDVVWERGKRILFFTVVSMFLGMLATLLIPNRYASTATILMSKSKLGEQTMQNPAIPLDTYVDMMTTDDLMMEMINKYQLDESPFNLRYPDDMRGRLLVFQVQNSSHLKIQVALEDAQLAADVVNDLATKAIQKNQYLMEQEKIISQQRISEEIQLLKKNVTQTQNNYQEIVLENNKQVLIKELDTNQTILATLRQELSTLDNSIAEQKVKVEYYKDLFYDPLFERHPDFEEKITLFRSIFSDNLSLEMVKQATSELDLDSLTEKGIVDEVVNQGYLDVLKEYTSLQVSLPGLIAKRIDAASKIAALETKVEEQNDRFHEIDIEETEAKANWDRALEVYAGIEKNLGWAGTNIYSERQDLILVGEAVPIEKKIYPRRSLMIALVGLVAFLLALMYFLLSDLYGLLRFGKPITKKDESKEQEA